MNRVPTSVLAFLWVALCCGCSDQGPGVSGGDGGPRGDGVTNQPAPPGSVYVLVTDHQARAVEGATVGRSLLTASGVALGKAEASSKGWVTVTASGYVPTEVKPILSFRGHALGEVRLTPVRGVAVLQPGGTATIRLVDEVGAVRLVVPLAAAAFAAAPVVVRAAWIAPADLGAARVPLSDGKPSTLLGAFALYAQDAQLSSIGLRPGEKLVVSVARQPLGSAAVAPLLAAFNPEGGRWEQIPAACAEDPADASRYRCQLPRLATCFGFFSPESSGSRGYALSSTEESYYRAKQAFDRRAAELESSGQDPQTDGALGQLADDLATAAEAYAAERPGSIAIQRLINAAAAALLAGRTQRGEELKSKATAMVEAMVEKALAQAACDSVRELLLLLEKLILVDGREELQHQVRQKISDIMKKCRWWIGTIDVSLPPGSPHPADENMQLVSGGGWHEHHSVKMFVDPQTGALRGEDTVELEFASTLKYREADSPCNNAMEYSAAPSLASVGLVFSGTWDGQKLTVGPMSQGQSSGSTTIKLKVDMYVEDDDGKCVTAPGYPMTIPFIHRSVMAHGIGSPDPVFTFQQLVDQSGWRENFNGDPDGRVFSGFAFFAHPDPEVGIIPSAQLQVVWHLVLVPTALQQ